MFKFLNKYKTIIINKKICNKYRNNNASNGGCMGVSLDWVNTREECVECKRYYENIKKSKEDE